MKQKLNEAPLCRTPGKYCPGCSCPYCKKKDLKQYDLHQAHLELYGFTPYGTKLTEYDLVWGYERTSPV